MTRRSDAVEAMRFVDQAFQPYAAGSTGVPKGIILTHAGMLWGIEHNQLYRPRHAAERGIVAAPMSRKNALRGTIKPLMRVGGSFVIMRRFEPHAHLAALAKHDVTFCGGVPAMYSDLLGIGLGKTPLPRLEVLSMGSSTVPQELVMRLESALPTSAIKDSYGLTEGGGALRAALDGRPPPPGSVGVPAPEYEIRRFCAAHGPGYAIPRAVIVMGALPLTPTGKPDRARLRSLMSQRFGTLRSRPVPGWELRPCRCA